MSLRPVQAAGLAEAGDDVGDPGQEPEGWGTVRQVCGYIAISTNIYLFMSLSLYLLP